MQGFGNRQEFDQWRIEQYLKYGIIQPDTYNVLTTEEEIETEMVTE